MAKSVTPLRASEKRLTGDRCQSLAIALSNRVSVDCVWIGVKA